jgi:hypothetical protein
MVPDEFRRKLKQVEELLDCGASNALGYTRHGGLMVSPTNKIGHQIRQTVRKAGLSLNCRHEHCETADARDESTERHGARDLIQIKVRENSKPHDCANAPATIWPELRADSHYRQSWKPKPEWTKVRNNTLPHGFYCAAACFSR